MFSKLMLGVGRTAGEPVGDGLADGGCDIVGAVPLNLGESGEGDVSGDESVYKYGVGQLGEASTSSSSLATNLA